MNDTELLKYGFILYLKGEATYDHLVKAKIPYANGLIEQLQNSSQPVIAQRYYPGADSRQAVTSPLFRYVSAKSGISSYQSAYYLADSLMKKGMLPVYIRETGEIKDLMPLLSKEQKQDAIVVMQILRARYIKPEQRRPAQGFMLGGVEEPNYDAETIQISDDEMMRIFGRKPLEDADTDVDDKLDSNVVPLRLVTDNEQTQKSARG